MLAITYRALGVHASFFRKYPPGRFLAEGGGGSAGWGMRCAGICPWGVCADLLECNPHMVPKPTEKGGYRGCIFPTQTSSTTQSASQLVDDSLTADVLLAVSLPADGRGAPARARCGAAGAWPTTRARSGWQLLHLAATALGPVDGLADGVKAMRHTNLIAIAILWHVEVGAVELPCAAARPCNQVLSQLGRWLAARDGEDVIREVKDGVGHVGCSLLMTNH